MTLNFLPWTDSVAYSTQTHCTCFLHHRGSRNLDKAKTAFNNPHLYVIVWVKATLWPELSRGTCQDRPSSQFTIGIQLVLEAAAHFVLHSIRWPGHYDSIVISVSLSKSPKIYHPGGFIFLYLLRLFSELVWFFLLNLTTTKITLHRKECILRLI